MISLVDAGPGTGKTFSLVYGYLNLKRELYADLALTEEQEAIFEYINTEYKREASIAFFAHNNSTKDTLTHRLGRKGPKVYTFHGAGLSNVIKKHGYQKFVSNRTEKHIETLCGTPLKEMEWGDRRLWLGIKRLCHYFKIEALDPTPENLVYLTGKYPDLSSYVIPDNWKDDVEDLLAMASRPDGTVEFADMIYLGKKALSRPRFAVGFVDESQDISRSTYQLVTRMCENVFACGDVNQAINAWNGASEEMYKKIASKSDAILPLKVTQRCPAHICEKANMIRPGGVVHGPNNIDGVETTITHHDLLGRLANCPVDSTLLLCRTNATLLGIAIFLHERGVPCTILDKDLAKELTNFINNFRAKTLPALNAKLDSYLTRARYSRNPLWEAMCAEKVDCIRKLMAEVNTYEELIKSVKTYTSIKGGHMATTIHKAKGLEAPNVFVIGPPMLEAAREHPITWEQEKNLHFVSVTRSSQNLYWVQ